MNLQQQVQTHLEQFSSKPFYVARESIQEKIKSPKHFLILILTEYYISKGCDRQTAFDQICLALNDETMVNDLKNRVFEYYDIFEKGIR